MLYLIFRRGEEEGRNIQNNNKKNHFTADCCWMLATGLLGLNNNRSEISKKRSSLCPLKYKIK
jgi:hypothetical protein